MSASDPRWNVWHELGAVASAFVASRLLVFGTIYLSRLEIIRGPLWQPGNWIDALTHGDGVGYLDCARELARVGACYPDPTIAWFPLYSWLVAGVAFFLRDPALAALLIANVCLFASGWFLYRLVRFEIGEEHVSRAAVMLLMFSPGALFFSTATADSMLLLLSIAALGAARSRRWGAAAVCAVLAGATMNFGLLLIVPLTVELVSQLREPSESRLRLSWQSAVLLAAIAGQLIAAITLGQAQFHDQFALLRISADSQATLARLVDISATFASQTPFWNCVFAGTTIAATLLCIAGLRMNLRGSYVSFAMLLVCACAVSFDFEAPRTIALAFPLSLAAALVVRRFEWLYEPMLLFSVGLLALFTILFANGHWLT